MTLLYTVLETQLAESAKRAASLASTAFQPSDLRGHGVEAAALYLEKVGAYDVRRDVAWQRLCDLRDLRHLIVHRAGTKGQSEEHLRTARRLATAYSSRIVFPESDWSWYGEVWISLSLCRELIETVETFFDRLFEALGLPPRYEARKAKGQAGPS